MAIKEHLEILKQGVEVWNQWRIKNPEIRPDLSGSDGIDHLMEADLNHANLTYVNLRRTNLALAFLNNANLSSSDLSYAILNRAHLNGAKLAWANLSETDFGHASLRDANLDHANLSNAILSYADLAYANLQYATLRNTSLQYTTLVETNFKGAIITGCSIYGVSAWNLNLEKATQLNFIITHNGEPTISVDNLEVAQFIYLLLNRQKLRNVIDSITSKAVLILGRFTAERKAVLDSLADELRKHNLLPIIFDFDRSTNRDFTETIKILAGLSLFVIVDITKPKAAPQELTAIVPDYQIPFVPILEEGKDPYAMFVDFMKYDWVLKPVLKYSTQEVLLENFRNFILERAWKKHLELQRKKNEELEIISIEDMIK